MDWNASVYGIAAMWVIVFGACVFFLGTKQGRAYSKFTPSTAKGAKVVGAVVVLVGFGTAAGWSLSADVASVSDVDLLVTAAEDTDQGHITIDNADQEIEWTVHFNYTGDGAFLNSTNTATINFTLSRQDSSDDDVIAKCLVSDKGSVVDETEGKSYTLVNKGADWSLTWTKRGSVAGDTATITGDTATIGLEAAASEWVTLQVTLNANACDSMSTYDSEMFHVTFGGSETFTFIVQVVNWAGSPPT